MERYYAGIGSRKTPEPIMKELEEIGKILASNCFTLRSGGATGADTAFEIGADIANGKKEIYLPWRYFNGNPSPIFGITNECFELTLKYTPKLEFFKRPTQLLICRDTYQVLGYDLNTPVEFIVCYTNNGDTTGGTGYAIRIAQSYNIPIFNRGLYNDKELFINDIMNYINNSRRMVKILKEV